MSRLLTPLLALACASCVHEPTPSALARQPLAPPQAVPIDFARDWPKNSTLRLAQTLRVVLPVRSGTGYSWQVGDPLPPCLVLTSQTTLSSLGAPPGAPAEQILIFTATSVGEGDLVLYLVPPGRKTSDAVEMRTTRVFVTAE